MAVAQYDGGGPVPGGPMARSAAKDAPDTIPECTHSASSQYWAQYSRKLSVVVAKDTPKAIVLEASLGGPATPGQGRRRRAMPSHFSKIEEVC